MPKYCSPPLPRSSHRGVSWFKPANCWRARVSIGPKGNATEVSLGYFRDELKAAEAVATYRAEHPAWGRDLSRPSLRCLGPCGKEQPQDQFYDSGRPRVDGSMGKSSWCKRCARSAQRSNYKAHSEHHKAVAAEWRRANADRVRSYRMDRRARIRNAWVEHVNRRVVYEMHGGRCGICGEFIGGSFDVDHIVPLSRGGVHSYANVQPAHPRCNQDKGIWLPEEMT